MQDQAERLRQVIENKSEYDMEYMDSGSSMDIITITSGKGGVGKTNFSVNFAIALAKRGKRVIIMDADFGLANVDLVFGTRAKYDITDLLSGEKKIMDIMVDGYEGVKFISGGSGLTDLLNIDTVQINRVMGNLVSMENMADVLLIDTGAGVSDRVMTMVNASDESIVVITPDPTSIMDAFAMIKSILSHNPFHKVRIVMNRADTQEEAKAIAENFIDVVKKFLGVKITSLGTITDDRAVSKAVRNQVPFIVESPYCDAAICIGNIADEYLQIPKDESKSGGFRNFVKKLVRKK